MSIENRLASLKAQHAELESNLSIVTKQPSRNDADITDIKRQKLALRDEIHKLETA